jgi:hypothetical protein
MNNEPGIREPDYGIFGLTEQQFPENEVSVTWNPWFNFCCTGIIPTN